MMKSEQNHLQSLVHCLFEIEFIAALIVISVCLSLSFQ